MDKINAQNIYYLGPDGSNTYNAMLKLIDICNIKSVNRMPVKSIKSAFEGIKSDNSSVCVLPIENSIEGIVRETIDNLVRLNDTSIQIIAETSIPINHMLLCSGNDKLKIKKIISHPQALAQCSRYIYKTFGDIELKEVSSTGYAAKKISEVKDETLAAIANESCAKLFNLNILEASINDENDNQTRFYLLGRNCFNKNQCEKTAIMLSTKNHAGALCDVLKILSNHGINLTYIDSRPSRKVFGEYLFFMELDGYSQDTGIQTALKELKQYVDFLKILGSFVKYN
ncbi:MAG: prephenate dehydratase [Candidatus Gastranaerophilales bacterium]|nr:prephenate dehydratase [Candidatus Gastranaerophilales bacterium]